jgi:hypothetical protein
MTRDELLARRSILLPIYQNATDPVQRTEVETELAAIRDQLRDLPGEPRKKPTTPSKHGRRNYRGWRSDGAARASGDFR